MECIGGQNVRKLVAEARGSDWLRNTQNNGAVDYPTMDEVCWRAFPSSEKSWQRWPLKSRTSHQQMASLLCMTGGGGEEDTTEGLPGTATAGTAETGRRERREREQSVQYA